MSRIILAILLFLKSCDADLTVNPRFVCKLPKALPESSGLVMTGPNFWWSHNDRLGEAELQAFDTMGNLVHTLLVPGATKVDWEDLAHDPAGRLFIGDFGNNRNNRRDLAIYWFDWDGRFIKGPVHTLHYSYPDQTNFPAPVNFDMEGFFHHNDSLYLFSKNKNSGGNGYCKIYRLPVDTGRFEAELLDSIQLGLPVTSADISPSGEMVVLLSYGKLFLFFDFGDAHFWKGERLDMAIPVSQTEAVAFASDTKIYLTNEQRSFFELDLYKALRAKGLYFQ